MRKWTLPRVNTFIYEQNKIRFFYFWQKYRKISASVDYSISEISFKIVCESVKVSCEQPSNNHLYTDVNPWVEIANEPVVIFVQVFIGIVCLVALILSFHKLIELLIYSHRNKCFKETALPLIVLILQVIANASEFKRALLPLLLNSKLS